MRLCVQFLLIRNSFHVVCTKFILITLVLLIQSCYNNLSPYNCSFFHEDSLVLFEMGKLLHEMCLSHLFCKYILILKLTNLI